MSKRGKSKRSHLVASSGLETVCGIKLELAPGVGHIDPPAGKLAVLVPPASNPDNPPKLCDTCSLAVQ